MAAHLPLSEAIGEPTPARHPASAAALQRKVKRTIQAAGITQHGGYYTLPYSFATHLSEDGYDLPTIQESLGHSDVGATQTYTHVLNRGSKASRARPSVIRAFGASGHHRISIPPS